MLRRRKRKSSFCICTVAIMARHASDSLLLDAIYLAILELCALSITELSFGYRMILCYLRLPLIWISIPSYLLKCTVATNADCLM